MLKPAQDHGSLRTVTRELHLQSAIEWAFDDRFAP